MDQDWALSHTADNQGSRLLQELARGGGGSDLVFRTKDLVDGYAGKRRRIVSDCVQASSSRGWWGAHKNKEACAPQQQESTLLAQTRAQAAVVAGQVLKLLTVYGLLVCVRRLERALK